MDAVEIINRALARIGCLPIQSVLAPGPAGTQTVRTYDAILEDLLSKYPWHFTKRFSSLNKLTAAPPLGWVAQFQLPPTRLSLPRAYFESASSDQPTTRVQMAGNVVYARSETLFAEWQEKPLPIEWPGHFRELMTLALAAEYAMEIREDPQLRNELRRDCYGSPQDQGMGGQFKVCSDLDASSNPSPQPAGGRNPLTDIRNDYWNDPDDARGGW